MKCVVKNSVIKRVSDTQAAELVSKGWAFTNKKLWKEQVRDAVKIVPVVVEASSEPTTEVKKKKVQGRQLAKSKGEN